MSTLSDPFDAVSTRIDFGRPQRFGSGGVVGKKGQIGSKVPSETWSGRSFPIKWNDVVARDVLHRRARHVAGFDRG